MPEAATFIPHDGAHSIISLSAGHGGSLGWIKEGEGSADHNLK
jgi:hypothetical protein